MKFTEFKNNLNDKTFNAYLFEGEDAFFCERGLSLLKDKFLTEPSLNFAEFNGENLEISELLASLLAYPFMSEKRITLVREFYPNASTLKELQPFFQGEPSSSLLVIINSKPFSELKKVSDICIIDCSKEDSAVLAKWVRAEANSNGVNIDFETAKLLAEYCTCDMKRISIETDKLCAYVGNGGTVSGKDVEQMVAKDNDFQIYEMTDYVGKKQYDSALLVINDMLSRGETPQRILTSIYNYYRRLLHASISDKSDLELSKLFGIKEYAAKKTKEQALKFKRKALKEAVDLLIDADYKVKSGLADINEEMWLLIFKIMTR